MNLNLFYSATKQVLPLDNDLAVNGIKELQAQILNPHLVNTLYHN